MRSRERQTSAVYKNRRKGRKTEGVLQPAALACEWTVNTAWLLHCLSLLLFCLEVSSLAPSSLMSKQRKLMKTKSPAISSSLTRGPKPVKHHLSVWFTARPIQQVFKVDSADKMLLCSFVSVLSVTPPMLRTSEQAQRKKKPQKFLCETWSTNAYLHVCFCSVPMTAALMGCWRDTAFIIESSQ